MGNRPRLPPIRSRQGILKSLFISKSLANAVLIFRYLLFVTPVQYRQVIPDDRPTNFDTANVLDSNDSSPRRTATIRQTLHIATARRKQTFLQMLDLGSR